MIGFESWLRDLFIVPSITQTIIILSIVCALGLMLGKLRAGNISLGITFVFFVGIFVAHFGITVNPDMLAFAQSFGLVVFVYALGLEVGPSFFPSLKRGGVAFNGLSLLLIIVTLILCWMLSVLFHVSMPNMLGIMSGAVTNTPVLAALQDTLGQINPAGTSDLANMALACAVTYPLGVVGVILALSMMSFWRVKALPKNEDERRKAFVSEFEVINPAVFNKTVKQIVALTDRHFVISRVWHHGELILPKSNSTIMQGDHLLIISNEDDVERLSALFGKRDDSHDWNRPDIDWDAIDSQLVSKRIIITKSKLNGVKLGTLKLRNQYGINITRVDRAGIELLPVPDLYLQIGDRLTVVGDDNAVSQVSKLLGDQIKTLDKPKLVSLFVGLFLGCVLGMIPFFIPGVSMPIKLGLAGGPIILGILMGAFGPRFHVHTYMTNSAIQVIKQMGIVIYLAGLGLASGAHFFETIFRGDGLLWVGIGFIITLVPTIIIGVITNKVFKVSLGKTAGMICGSMANPMALDYANSLDDSDDPAVVYATVYPMSMFLRIITAQLMLLMFL
ncbi:putative transporter [Porphyromonas pogonae]|uniref:putative transporter n=1 Tax=Porphyromonas pogonae TaxID=867595 RepID=UPI002E791B5D|nr:putative transporter [Porphyromonas pogonae]